jgi:pimeloyl-ACP methyl ester carboxylesterase
MSHTIPWNSQPLDDWSAKHARGKFIELDGLSTHYIEKGAGAPVILLHGFFFDTNMWNKSIDVLAEKYKVYAIDLWGFGYSTREPLDYGYTLYRRQLLAFMDALGIEKASLIGQSMGAGTIMNFTIANRERVEKIVLVNAAGMPNRLPFMGRLANLPLVGEILLSMRGEFMRRMTLGNTFLHRKELITEELFANVTRFHQIEGTTNVMLTITRKDFFQTLQNEIQTLGTLDVPMLIVWGRQEKSIPLATGEKLHGILSSSQFEVLDQAGHCSNMDQPERFNELVLKFLA